MSGVTMRTWAGHAIVIIVPKVSGGGECSGRVFNDVLTCQRLPTFIRT